MSQRDVERVIGMLVTDEAFRRRFARDPAETLRDVAVIGLQLSPCELQALAATDPTSIARFADAIDARIHKTDLCGGNS
jgi:hypothetical protein